MPYWLIMSLLRASDISPCTDGSLIGFMSPTPFQKLGIQYVTLALRHRHLSNGKFSRGKESIPPGNRLCHQLTSCIPAVIMLVQCPQKMGAQ